MVSEKTNLPGSRSWGDSEQDGTWIAQQRSNGKSKFFVMSLCSLSLFILCYFAIFSGNTGANFPPTEKIRQRVKLPEIILGMATSFDGVAVQQSYLQLPESKILLERYPVAFEPIEGAVSPLEGEIAEPFF